MGLPDYASREGCEARAPEWPHARVGFSALWRIVWANTRRGSECHREPGQPENLLYKPMMLAVAARGRNPSLVSRTRKKNDPQNATPGKRTVRAEMCITNGTITNKG